MRRLFLIRAYGDFVIAIRAILFSPHPLSIKIVASEHFKPLHTSLAKVMDLAALEIEFQNFEINNAQLNLFTDRHLLSIGTLTQIKKIKNLKSISKLKTKIIFFSPGGKKFDTKYAKDAVKKYSDVILICGRY